MGVSRFSVERPVTILMFFIAVIVLGMISLMRLPIELMPDNDFGTITIHVGIRGGMPPTEVETLVTEVIEEAVASVSHIRNLSSTSKEGESTVSLEFEPGTNMDFAGLEVREKFARIKNRLPKEIEKPVIAKYSQSDVPVVILTMSSLRRTPEMLRKLVDTEIKERFMRVNGVANIDIGGGRERKVLYDIDQKKLLQFGLSINQVINMISINNLNLLVGSIERSKDRYLIRTIGDFKNIEEIKMLPVTKSEEGSVIRIRDIGVVKDSFLEPKGFARLNLKPVVSLYMQKESSANTVKTAHEILQMKEMISKDIPADIQMKVISNQAEKIEDAINTVKSALINGALLAIIILYVFLRNLKATFIIGSAIPVSVVATFIFMNMNDITINVMTLSGMALGIGMLVDSAIVVLENIFKYKEQGISDVRSAVIGSEEVVMSIIASTITTIVVFLPIMFMNKKIQLQYSGLAFTVTFSLLASLVVSISLIPMLFSRLSSGHQESMQKKSESYLVKKMQSLGTWLLTHYRRFLVTLIRYRYRLALVVLTALALAVYHFIKIDKDLNAGGDSRKFTAFVELPSGAKLDKSNEIVRKVEALFKEMPEVETFSSRVEGWSSKIYITLKPQHQRNKTTKQIIEELRPQVKNFKDAFIYFQEDSAADQKEVTVDLYGYDYKVLKELAVSVASRFGTVPDFKDVKIRMREGRPEMHILLDREMCAAYGLTVKEVAEIVHAKMRGLRASTYSTEGKEVEIVARLREVDRDTFGEIKKMSIALKSGEHISLDQVAEFDFDLGPSEIWRRNKSRMIQVSANREVSLTKAVEKSRAVLADMEFPDDYYYQFGEEYKELQESSKQMAIALLLTLFLIYLVLGSLFESYYQPFIILVTVPLALIGVTAVLKILGNIVTMGTMIGFIMLGGIVVNNAIILIDSVNRYVREKKMRPLRAIVTVGQKRMRPIMMTTLTTILGLLPMALDKSESSDLWSPLAITVISGLASATFLTLFVVPCVFIIFEEWRNAIGGWFGRRFQKKIVSSVQLMSKS